MQKPTNRRIFTLSNKQTITTKSTIMKKVTNDIKSKVMKAAWTIFRKDTKKTWSEALKKAWAWAKKNLLAIRYEFCNIIGEALKYTEKAVRMDINGYAFWIPKSVIVEETSGGIIIKRWFADKNFNDNVFGICCHYC